MLELAYRGYRMLSNAKAAVTAVCLSLCAAAPATAAAVDPQTMLSQFTLVALDDADTSNVQHVEGKVYVGGDMTTGNFYANSDAGADGQVGDASGSLIVGGDVIGNLQSGGNGSILVGGTVTGGNTSGQPIATGVGVDTPGGVPVSEVTAAFNGFSQTLASMEQTAGAGFTADMNQARFTAGDGDENGVAIINVDASQAASIFSSTADLLFTVDPDVTLVINVAGGSFNNVGVKVNNSAKNVLFNFASATSLVFSANPFNTSLLAPLASFSSPDGGTRGSMVVGSLSQMKGEIRSFADGSTEVFQGDLSSVSSAVPLPGAAALLAGGLACLGGLRLRRSAA